MKTGIFIIAAALAMALFAVPDTPAQAWWWNRGPDLNLRISGSNFITSSTDGRPTPLGLVSTSMQSGIAKGKSGNSVFTAQTIVEMAGDLQELCGASPEQGIFGAGLSTTTVFTYKDGSTLSLTTALNDADEPLRSYYCYDASTGNFSVEFEGSIAGGTGRFEGATGTWEGTADTIGGAGIVTAHVMVDLDKGSRSHHDHGDSDRRR